MKFDKLIFVEKHLENSKTIPKTNKLLSEKLSKVNFIELILFESFKSFLAQECQKSAVYQKTLRL